MSQALERALGCVFVAWLAANFVVIALGNFGLLQGRDWIPYVTLGVGLACCASLWLARRKSIAKIERAEWMLCPWCEYDLCGAPRDADGVLRCSECDFYGTLKEVKEIWERRYPKVPGNRDGS